MRYRLSTLLLCLVIGPIGLAGLFKIIQGELIHAIYLGPIMYVGGVVLFCHVMGIGGEQNSEPPPPT